MKYTETDFKLIIELVKSLNTGRPNGGTVNAMDAIRQYDYIKEKAGFVESEHEFEVTCYNQYGLILQAYKVNADYVEDAKDKVINLLHNEFPCDYIGRIELVDETGETYLFKESEIYD